MRRVVLESPYAGEVVRNLEYARAALRDSLNRGEAPIASHLLYTQPGVLDDLKTEERKKGIDAGHAWMGVAEAVVVYQDLGLTQGMVQAIAKAKWLKIPVEGRYLYGKTDGNQDSSRA